MRKPLTMTETSTLLHETDQPDQVQTVLSIYEAVDFKSFLNAVDESHLGFLVLGFLSIELSNVIAASPQAANALKSMKKFVETIDDEACDHFEIAIAKIEAVLQPA